MGNMGHIPRNHDNHIIDTVVCALLSWASKCFSLIVFITWPLFKLAAFINADRFEFKY